MHSAVVKLSLHCRAPAWRQGLEVTLGSLSLVPIAKPHGFKPAAALRPSSRFMEEAICYPWLLIGIGAIGAIGKRGHGLSLYVQGDEAGHSRFLRGVTATLR